MKLVDKIRDKIPGMENYFNQKALIWRNRGDGTALEILDTVRIKYSDKPDRHELSTGEVIPAVPKDYVGNMYGGGSYWMAVEASDDQLVVFRADFELDSGDALEELDKIEIDSSLESDEVMERFEDKNFDVVKFSVLDNRDERFTFLANEIETSEDKYSLGHMIWDNMNVVSPIVAAVAVAIVMYTMTGDIVPAIKNFTEQLTQFGQNLQSLEQTLNQTAPPGR